MPTPPIPGQPHPDVATVKSILRKIEPGATIPYSTIAAAINVPVGSQVFKSRTTTARKQLERDEQIVIACVPGEGFLRELPAQTKGRVEGRETRSIHRKATKNIQQLMSIDPSELPESERPELYAQLTINGVARKVTGKSAKTKLIAASAVTSAELATQKALEILRNSE